MRWGKGTSIPFPQRGSHQLPEPFISLWAGQGLSVSILATAGGIGKPQIFSYHSSGGYKSGIRVPAWSGEGPFLS